MKTLYTIFSSLLLVLLYSGCDQVTGDYAQQSSIHRDTATNVRKILIEDYTGFKCGNCPAAGEIATSLEEKYPGRVMIMEVHAGFFATPDSKHTYDFRTPVGDELDQFFGISKVGNPNGMIDRINLNGSQIIPPVSWDAAIQSLLDSVPEMNLKLTAYYSQGNGEISVDADVTYLSGGGPNDYLCVYIIEDSIVQYQTDYRKNPIDIPNYVHNHVLRASFNGTWGEQLYNGTIKAGSVIRKSYSFKIPEGSDWRLNKLKILAFVNDYGKTYKIFQAEETSRLILTF